MDVSSSTSRMRAPCVIPDPHPANIDAVANPHRRVDASVFGVPGSIGAHPPSPAGSNGSRAVVDKLDDERTGLTATPLECDANDELSGGRRQCVGVRQDTRVIGVVLDDEIRSLPRRGAFDRAGGERVFLALLLVRTTSVALTPGVIVQSSS